MSSAAQSAFILLAIVFSFIWLQIPGLEYYSLQLVALIVLAYFVIKFLNKNNRFRFTPATLTPEIALITAAFLVFIGSTGTLESLFFPLSYLYLFFLVIVLAPFPAIMASLAVMTFFYILSPDLTPQHISSLLSLPLLLTVFLFTKKQYEYHKSDSALIDLQDRKIEEKEHQALLFIRTFLQPKLENLYDMSFHPQENKTIIQEQIKLMYGESEALLQELHDQDNDTEVV